MRINLKRSKQKGVIAPFLKQMIGAFAEEYDLASERTGWEYVLNGKQGLQTFVEFLIANGYKAAAYSLEPNREPFRDLGADWTTISRDSPSYGIVIDDHCPTWVEFKLRNG